MIIVHMISLDMRNISLRTKRREAIHRLKSGLGYSTFVLRMDGRLIQYSISNDTKRGYTERTLLPSQYKIVGDLNAKAI